jgi:hypothetical protein
MIKISLIQMSALLLTSSDQAKSLNLSKPHSLHLQAGNLDNIYLTDHSKDEER